MHNILPISMQFDMPILQCYQIAAMVECAGRFFANRHSQFVKNCGAMTFYGGNSCLI
jgi:hypothetical protein